MSDPEKTADELADEELMKDVMGTTFPQKVEARRLKIMSMEEYFHRVPAMTKDDGYGEAVVETLANGRLRMSYISGPRRGQVFDQAANGCFLRSPDEPVDRKVKTPR